MKFFQKLIDAIIDVEKEFFHHPGAGEIKKQKVIEIINKVIDIPLIPEVLEEKFLGFLIDLIVFIFNKYFLFNKS